MKKRIWFNRWFSTLYHYVEMIRNNDDGYEFEIYGTHPNINSVYLQNVDYAEQEPVLNESEYINYCLDFCKKHKIDVFIPYYRAVPITENIKKFEAIGTKLLVPQDIELMNMISDKGRLFASCKENKFMTLPDYHIVNNAEQFAEAYRDLKEKGHKVCFKPVDGVGGVGFRIIKEGDTTMNDLLGNVSHYVPFEVAYKVFSEQDSFDDLMVMEYLAGYEYSIDCLSYDGKLLAAVPRKKIEKRVRELENIPELLEIAQRVNDIYKIPFAFNIQVKYSNGIPKLLEINPRMSGGLNVSCLSGINFPYLAIKLLLTEEANVPQPNLGIKASYVERDIILKEIN